MFRHARVVAVLIPLLSPGTVHAQISPELAATAGAGAVVPSTPWGALHNPATIASNGVPVLALWGEPSPYGLAGLVRGGVAYYTEAHDAGIVISVRGTDYDAYHDIGIDGACAVHVEPDLALGVRIGAQVVGLGGWPAPIPSVSLGFVLRASSDMRLGGCWHARHEPDRPVEQAMELACAFDVDRGAMILGALRGSTRGDRDASIGLAIAASDAVTLLCGVAATEGRFGIGTAITRGPFILHVAVVSTSSIGTRSVLGVITPL